MNAPTVAIACRNNPNSPGGIEAVVRELVKRLRVAYPQWNIRAAWAFERQTGLARIPLIGDLIAGLRIAWRTRDADVVAVNGAEYAWPLLARRRSTIVVWHGTRAAEVPNLTARMSFSVRVYWRLEKLLQSAALLCARQVAVSPTVVQEVRSAYGYAGAFDVIVNGGGERARAERSRAETTEFRVLWIGVQAYKKGWDVALQACRIARVSIPNLRLVAAGLRAKRPDEPWVEWLGPVPHRFVQEEYLRANALLGTSRYEACSMAIIEALAHGVPVLASTAIAWMVDEGGVRVDVDSAHAFARALAQLADDRLRLDSLSQGAIADASHFRWDDAARRYGAIIADVCGIPQDDSERRAVS